MSGDHFAKARGVVGTHTDEIDTEDKGLVHGLNAIGRNRPARGEATAAMARSQLAMMMREA